MDGTSTYIYNSGTAPAEQVNLVTGAVTYLVAEPPSGRRQANRKDDSAAVSPALARGRGCFADASPLNAATETWSGQVVRELRVPVWE